MWSSIPIEPMHLFAYSYLRQWQITHGRLLMYNNDEVVQDGAHACQPVFLTSLQFDMRDPFYGQLTAVKSRHLQTSAT